MREPIYLDHNATTPIAPEVRDAMLPYLSEHFGNPSSGHVYGQRARAAVEHARSQVARLIECDADEIVFTSGGTEANNLAIFGAIEAAPRRRGVVTSVIEHPATSAPCDWLEQHGHAVTRLPVDAHGRTLLPAAEGAIGAETCIVTVMHSHNETGVLQPIDELTRLTKRAGALMHTDAAQSVGKVPVSVRALGVDLLSIAGHKLYAPKGVGALFVKQGTALAPLSLGASHERGLRPGTENVAGIVALGRAAELAGSSLGEAEARTRGLRDELFTRLVSAIPGLVLYGHPALRLPNTLFLRFPAVSGPALLAATPDVAASTGSACHDGQTAGAQVLLEMGVLPADAVGTVRLTLGRSTRIEDVTRAADALTLAWRSLASSGRSGP